MLLTFGVLIPVRVGAQAAKTLNNVTLKKGERKTNLKRFNEFSVVYTKKSQGSDSISTEVYSREIRSRRDTLYVKPTDVTQYRYMDTIRPYQETKYYPPTTNVWIRIPQKEIEVLKAKRQPLCKVTGALVSISYVTLICSPFIAMNKNPDISDFGVHLFIASIPVLAVNLSINAIWGKKKYRFEKKRSGSNSWELAK